MCEDKWKTLALKTYAILFFFLILLKIKKIETHPHAEQRLQACSIYCTGETNKLKIQDYQNEHIHCI